MSDENDQAIKAIFGFMSPSLTRIAEQFVDDANAAVAEAATVFDGMLETMAYRDNPGHPMALPLIFCNANLALFEVLRRKGVDAHRYGRAMLADVTAHPLPEIDSTPEAVARLRSAADASRADRTPGEFVFEVVDGDGTFSHGMNVMSCGICASFSRYDAMDLVPYMCATDDVMSDASGEGLRRTGTIALGAHHCDFRYGAAEPLRVADQYPERIQI